jgi:tripartite-type tricarboxylate transporter receptor subunit TctC
MNADRSDTGRPDGAAGAPRDRRAAASRRRGLLAAALGLTAAGALGRPRVALAQQAAEAWPTRPIKLVQPFSAGSGPDVITRFVARGMAERLGQNIVVEHKVGGSGLIGMQEVAGAAPDGYTIGYTNIAIAVAQELLAKGAFSLERDVAPIGGSSRSINVLVVPNGSPARTVAELVAMLKARPGGYSYASGGNGTPAHLNGEIFKRANGLFVVHVPYRGLAGAINDMVRGDIDLLFGTSGSMVPAIKGGRVRALAVAGPKRLPALPDVPTMAEAGFAGNEVLSWSGLVAPKGVPAPRIARMEKALAEVLADPATATFMEAQGAEPLQAGSAEFGALLGSESARWRRFVRETKLTVD